MLFRDFFDKLSEDLAVMERYAGLASWEVFRTRNRPAFDRLFPGGVGVPHEGTQGRNEKNARQRVLQEPRWRKP